MLVPVKGIKRYRSRGIWFNYHRATGARLTAEYGTAAFVIEVERLDARAAKKTTAPTVGSTIASYKASSFFRDLAAATKVSYERAFAEIESANGILLSTLTTGLIVGARDDVFATRGRWMANYYVTIFAVILDYARERGWIDHNPAKGIRRIRKDRAARVVNRPWTPAETRAVLDAAPAYLAVPIALAMLAGFRKGDVLSIEWAALVTKKVQVDGSPANVRFVSHRTAKRAVDVDFPMHPALANVLALAPPHRQNTIAATSRGTRWTESGFNSSFGKLIDRLEAAGKVAPGLTMHGLRHTVGTRLSEAGASEKMIKKLLGQNSNAMAHHYSKTADVSEEAAVLVGRMKVVGD